MNPSGKFRAFGSLVSVFVTAVVLLGATPARAAVTIDAPCAGTWSWNASTQTLSCGTVTPPAPGVPTGCVLTPSPTSLTAAGSVNLSVTCQSGSPTSFAWSAPAGVTFSSPSPTTTNTNSATITANTNFTVIASNAVGPAATAQALVTVGGVAGGLSCPGFAKTILVNWDWASGMTKVDTFYTQNGLGTNGILVVPFIPTGPANNVLAQISATGYPSPSMENDQTLAISSQPCDLVGLVKSESPSPTVRYVVGTSPLMFGKPQGASLTPGGQYYINIAGRQNVSATSPSGTQTCVPGGNYPFCDVRLSVQKPTGH